MATEPIHHLTEWAQVVATMTGDTPPYLLINMGLVGVGLRGAVE